MEPQTLTKLAALVAALEAAAALSAIGALKYLSLSTLRSPRRNAVSLTRVSELKRSVPHLIVLLIIVSIGAVGRIMHLSQSMRFDEAFTYTSYASKPLIDGLSNYSYPNNHLLHTLLVHISVALFGNSPWAIRLPAFAAGILLIPTTYLLTRVIANRQAGLLAAAAVAGSAPLILYSTNARGYSLIGLLTLSIFVIFASLSTEPGTRWKWIVLAVLASLGMWVAPIMLFPLCGALAWFFCTGPKVFKSNPRYLLGRVGASAILAGSLTLMFYAPPLVRGGRGPLIANRFVTPHSLSILASEMPMFVRDLWRGWTYGLPAWGQVVFVGGFALVFLPYRGQPRRVLQLAIATISAAALLILFTRRTPPARVLLYLLPLLWAAASLGLQHLVTWVAARVPANGDVLVSAAAVVMAAALTYHVAASRAVLLASTDTDTLLDAPELAAIIKRERHPGDYLVTASPSGPPLVYYAGRLGLSQEALYGRPADGGRLLVVVNEYEAQTLQSVLTVNSDVNPDCSMPPRVLYRLPFTSLVEVGQASPSGALASPTRLEGCTLATGR